MQQGSWGPPCTHAPHFRDTGAIWVHMGPIWDPYGPIWAHMGPWARAPPDPAGRARARAPPDDLNIFSKTGFLKN